MLSKLKRLYILFACSVVWILPIEAASSYMAEPVVKGPVKLEAEWVKDEGGASNLYLLFSLSGHWHLYWKNAGEIEEAQNLRVFNGDRLLESIEYQWPVPSLEDSSGIVNFIHEKQLLLVGEIDTDIEITQGLRVEADWIVCEETCIPGYGEVNINGEEVADVAVSRLVEKFEGIFPVSLKDVGVRMVVSNKRDRLNLHIAGDDHFKTAYIFEEIFREKLLMQKVVNNQDGSLELELFGSPELLSDLSSGVLRLEVEDGKVLGIQIGKDFWSGIDAEKSVGVQGSSSHSYVVLLFFAFIGGLILNLMPCVFPVLGLKIMSFVNLAGQDKSKVKWYGIAYSAGILVSFMVLAAGLYQLRASGVNVGWGYQLQYPIVVIVLALVFLTFSLNLLGCFEIGYSLVGVDQKFAGKSSSHGYFSSFGSGVLATIAATPCSAPLLGPALGGAVLLEPGFGVILFIAMALGLASPYLLLSFVPSLIQYLPKPGNWMVLLKEVLAFPMLGAVLYLAWILVGQLEGLQLLWVFASFLLWAMGLWIYGKAKYGKGFQIQHILALCLLFLSCFSISKSVDVKEQVWEEWSPSVQADYIKQGRNVWVDYTARWCNTCQVNKRLFDDEDVMALLAEKKVVLLKADWTRKDPKITESLKSLGQAAIPVNALYSRGDESPYLFSEILTKNDVLEQLTKLP